MSTLPNTTVTSVTREAWTSRAKEKGDFCNLTHDEQNQLAAAFGIEVPNNLDDIGRMNWATRIERSIQNGWKIPGTSDEVGFSSPGICMS